MNRRDPRDGFREEERFVDSDGRRGPGWLAASERRGVTLWWTGGSGGRMDAGQRPFLRLTKENIRGFVFYFLRMRGNRNRRRDVTEGFVSTAVGDASGLNEK